ncbi:MAG: YkgJ family cysteine cluster protein [Desulfuromonadaceae bacterium]|nr:YkgJ family cysteine cluster protein [Desulfuromonadaceae bacterium]
MTEAEFSCLLCGHCCLNLVDAYRGCVSDADLDLWRREGRDDLLAWVETLDLGHGNLLHTAWVDPETGDDVDRCPWLQELPEQRGYLCSINAVKPQHCREYPEHRRHGQQTGCPACKK